MPTLVDIAKIKVEKPIEVLFEGVSLDIYKLLETYTKNDLFKSIDSIPESFAYLYVGHWLQGDIGLTGIDNGLVDVMTFL